VCSRNPAAEASTRSLVARGRGLFRWFAPGRVWDNPFVWKDFHFVSGGVGMIPVRLGFCAGLWEVLILQSYWSPGGSGNWNQMITFHQYLLSLAVAIDGSRVLAQSIQDEIRGQTWGALLMLPRSTDRGDENTMVVPSADIDGVRAGLSPPPVIVLPTVFTAGQTSDHGNKNNQQPQQAALGSLPRCRFSKICMTVLRSFKAWKDR